MVSNRCLLVVLGIALMACVVGPALARAPEEPQDRAADSSPWRRAAFIPWGDAKGQLLQTMQSDDTGAICRGPTCMVAFEGGSFAILDSLGRSIKEYSPAGELTREVAVPALGFGKTAPVPVDMAASAPGDYWLLCPEPPAILHLPEKGEAQVVPIKAVPADAVLLALSRDQKGTLYILDGNDSSLHRIDAAGKALSSIRRKDLQGMAVDGNGHIYDLRLAGHRDARTLELVRWTEAEAEEANAHAGEPGFTGLETSGPNLRPEVVARITSDREVNRMDVFGVDKAGNIHVVMAAGAIEKPSRVEVVRFDSTGAVTGRVPCPLDPTELKFTHGKVVSPDGQVFALVVHSDGLEVLRLTDF